MRAGKEPVFGSNSHGPDGVLHQVVVDLQMPIVQVGHELIPEAQAVLDGLADGRTRQDGLALTDEPRAEGVQCLQRLGESQLFAFIARQSQLASFALDSIEVPDEFQSERRPCVIVVEGFVKCAPGMSPTGQAHNAIAGFLVMVGRRVVGL